MDNLLDIIHSLAPWAFGVLLVDAACCDARSYLIPNRLCLLIAALFVAYALTGSNTDFIGAITVAFAVLLASAALFAANQMGGGDVKLMTAAALWAGPAYALQFLLATAVAGGVLSLGVLLRPHFASLAGRAVATSNRRVPYGVAIAAGGLLVAAHLIGF